MPFKKEKKTQFCYLFYTYFKHVGENIIRKRYQMLQLQFLTKKKILQIFKIQYIHSALHKKIFIQLLYIYKLV